jgi:hypothetical protein
MSFDVLTTRLCRIRNSAKALYDDRLYTDQNLQLILPALLYALNRHSSNTE